MLSAGCSKATESGSLDETEKQQLAIAAAGETGSVVSDAESIAVVTNAKELTVKDGVM